MQWIRGSDILAPDLSAILDFGHSALSGVIGSTVIELADPENIGNDTNITSVSCSYMKLRGGITLPPLWPCTLLITAQPSEG